MAQSTVKLIVDAQNAIAPLKRVNEQTKALSSSTDKLKGRLDRSNRSLKNTGRAAKTASAGVGTLVGALKPLLAALAVVGTARFIFVKTAELETQRASLKQLTGDVEKTNQIIKELQDFGAVTPFTSSELIEQTKRLKAFGFQTEELVDTTKRLSDVAGATGADLTGIATAFGQIRAKGKLQQEENLQLLERGVNITDELKKITKLQGDEFESAMRKGEISAKDVNQALINLTSQGAIFAGGATAQADTLNGKLSTLKDTIDTLARTIGEELGDEIKSVLDLAISAVKEINKLVERVGVANKVGRINLANIDMAAKKEARQQIREEKGFIGTINPFGENRKKERELAEAIKKRKIEEFLATKEKEKQTKKTDELTKSIKKSKEEAEKIKNDSKETVTAIESQVNINDLFNSSLDQTSFLINDAALGSNKFADALVNVKSEADQLKEKFMEIGQGIEQGIVSNLTDAVMGTKSLAQAAVSVLNDLKRKLVEVAIQRAVSGIGNFIGGALGGIFGRGGGTSLTGNKASSFLKGVANPFARANGGPVSAGGAFLVGEKGPEILQLGSRGGNVIPNKDIGGTTNIVNVSVDASGSAVSGNNQDAQALGNVIGAAIRAELIKEKRAGGLLSR